MVDTEEIDRIHEYKLLLDHSVFMEAINKCLGTCPGSLCPVVEKFITHLAAQVT